MMTWTDPVRPRWPVPVVTIAITVAVLGPLLIGDGIALRGDMVFTPDQPWKSAWLGLDGSVPRAVPMDALVSLADQLMPGALVQRLLLVAAFVLGGLGIGRLASGFGALGQIAAVVVYLWNPWVFERLAIGQWSMVLGYGLLPWLVLAVTGFRDGRPGGRAATMLMLLLTVVCGPSIGLIASLIAVTVVAVDRAARRVLEVLGMAVLANLPWIVPSLLGPSLHPNQSQFGAFAAQGESSLGTLASLLSMGGIWKTSVVPPERTHVLVIAAAALLSLAFVVGFRYVVPAVDRRTARALGLVGAGSLLLALVPAIGPVADGLGTLSAHLTGLGMLRDSQRFLAPFGMLLALGAAALVARLRKRRALAVVLVVTPVLLLPSLAWGLAGEVQPVHYPQDWARVAALTGGEDGGVVVLPWTGSYRGFGWNDHRAVLDPAPRFLGNEVLIDDRVFLRDRVLSGEDPYLARVKKALDSHDPATNLRGLGVRWVLVEKENGVRAGDVPAGDVAFDGRWLHLVDLGAPEHPVSDVRQAPVHWVAVFALAMTVFAGCVSFWQLASRNVRQRG